MAKCPVCSSPLPADRTEGGCPRCLLALALQLGDTVNPSLREHQSIGPLLRQAVPAEGVQFYSFGDYDLIEVIARGGMGIVFRARHRRLNCDRALKLIQAGRLASPEVRRRFQSEAEATALLDHPNIVPLHEFGEVDGQYFLSMRFIDGGTLADALARTDSSSANGTKRAAAPTHGRTLLNLRSFKVLVRLMIKVTQAVHYAHTRGVIHRDLKPGNILLDRNGEPYVSDFGLARLGEVDSGLTVTGTALGTPAYMSPEQAAGHAREVSTATDVWSLGAILYELLGGQRPFQGTTTAHTLRLIQETDPKPPKAIRSDIPRDLETVCLHCLEKEAKRRYATAADLATDLERWLEGLPPRIRPVSGAERLVRWCRRKPVVASLVAVSLLAVVAAFLAGLNAIRVRERDALMPQLAEQRRRFNYVADMNLAQRAVQDGNMGLFRRTLDAMMPKPGESDLRGFEWHLLSEMNRGMERRRLLEQTNELTGLAVDVEGRWAAVVSSTELKLISLDDASLAKSWPLQACRIERGVALSADSQWIAVAGTNGVETFRTDDGIRHLLTSNPANIAVFHTREPLLAVTEMRYGPADPAADVWVFDVGTRELRNRLLNTDGPALFWESEGTSLRLVERMGRVVSWNVDSSAFEQLHARDNFNGSAAFSADGRLLARAKWFAAILVTEVASDRLLTRLPGAPSGVHLGFSRDGGWLAVCGTELGIQIYETTNWSSVRTLRGHTREVTGLAFLPENQELISCSRDGSVRLWSVDSDPPSSTLRVPHRLVDYDTQAPVFSPDSRYAAAPVYFDYATSNQSVLIELPSGQEHSRLPARPVSFSPDSEQLLTWSQDGELAVWDLASTQRVARFTLNPKPSYTEDLLTADAQTFVCLDDDGALHSVDSSNGRLRSTARAKALKFSLSPDSRHVAVALGDGKVALWDMIRNELSVVFDQEPVRMEFSPTGRTLAIAGLDHRIHQIDVLSRRPLEPLAGHQAPVVELAFTPDGRTLASSSDDFSLILWNLETRRETLIFRFEVSPHWLRFSPDGQWLVFGYERNTLKARDEYFFWPAPNEEGERPQPPRARIGFWTDVRRLNGMDRRTARD